MSISFNPNSTPTRFGCAQPIKFSGDGIEGMGGGSEDIRDILDLLGTQTTDENAPIPEPSGEALKLIEKDREKFLSQSLTEKLLDKLRNLGYRIMELRLFGRAQNKPQE